MEKVILVVGQQVAAQMDARELIVKLDSKLHNLESRMTEVVEAQIVQEIEENFIGTPAECRAALASVNELVVKQVNSAEFRQQYSTYFEATARQIIDVSFSASGFVSRKVFDRVYDHVAEDTDSNVERFDAICDMAELFASLVTPTGKPVVE